MRRYFFFAAIWIALLLSGKSGTAQTASPAAAQPRVLLFFDLNVEADHMLFATDAIRFFAEEADRHDFRVEATSNWADLNDENLKQYQLIVWLNSLPPGAQQPAFQRYMANAGAWLGFHVAAYNNRAWRWLWVK